MAVGQHEWYHFGVGAPPILVYFSGDWDVHWGYGVLTHSHIHLQVKLFAEDLRAARFRCLASCLQFHSEPRQQLQHQHEQLQQLLQQQQAQQLQQQQAGVGAICSKRQVLGPVEGIPKGGRLNKD